jgi:hypothetical protein
MQTGMDVTVATTNYLWCTTTIVLSVPGASCHASRRCWYISAKHGTRIYHTQRSLPLHLKWGTKITKELKLPILGNMSIE